MLKQKKWFVLLAAFFFGIAMEAIVPEYFTKTAYAMQTMYVAVKTHDGDGCMRISQNIIAADNTAAAENDSTSETAADSVDATENNGASVAEENTAAEENSTSGRKESTEAEENTAGTENGTSGVVTAQDIWLSAYRNLMYGTESSLEKVAALALSDVKAADLELMSSSTDRVVTYHGRRFAITAEDYEVLLKIVEAEASTEDIKGKMLVANVIMNRLEVGFCGNTIVEVVFAEGQFAPVANGRFFKMVPSEETIEAVERVLNGEDLSKGALYFMQRNAASKKGIRWFDENLKFLFEYGCHEFYTEKN